MKLKDFTKVSASYGKLRLVAALDLADCELTAYYQEKPSLNPYKVYRATETKDDRLVYETSDLAAVLDFFAAKLEEHGPITLDANSSFSRLSNPSTILLA
ncbi:MAG: hypothetical protein IJV64_13205 [Oscillospiraceae bacterium]|nr:hypothetical protein [Oscillospiraceae bacterium]